MTRNVKHKISLITIYILVFFIITGIFILAKDSILSPFKTSYATSGQFSLSPSSGTFYVGRQFEVRTMITTDEGSTASDFIINHVLSRIQVRDMDGGTTGIQIQPGNLYPNYPSGSNSASAGEIILTGFTSDTSGVLQGGGTGWFSTTRFFVINTDAGGSDVVFNFTGVGNTTDSNISDVLGIDMLDGVTNGGYILLEDTNDPYFSNWNPVHSATDIPVSANILFRANDDESGVDISSVDATIDGILYESTDATFGYNCTNANFDVVPYCNITINPATSFPYDYDVSVDLYTEDLSANPGDPPVADHNSATDSYSFHTEFDLNAPYTTNNNPAKSSSGSGVDTDIVFNLVDGETGVEISSVAVTVDGVVYTATGTNTFTYTGTPSNYLITINPDYDFEENEIIFVQVDARDNATQWGVAQYNWLHENYWFTTEDTAAPWVDRRIPDIGVNSDIGAQDSITFHVNDLGVGVDLASLEVIVNNVQYTNATFTYSGDSLDYLVTIYAPTDGWEYDVPVAIGVNACDFSHNCMITDVYSFVRLSYKCPAPETCTECPVCTVCDTTLSTSVTTTCDNTISTNSSKDEYIKNQMANSYSEDIDLIEINEKSFDGRVTFVWITKLKLRGHATPNSIIKINFDAEDMYFMIPVDEDGIWQLSLKNIFNFGNHDIHASLILDDTESEAILLGHFNIVNYWYAVLTILSGGTLIIYTYKKYIRKKNESKTYEN